MERVNDVAMLAFDKQDQLVGVSTVYVDNSLECEWRILPLSNVYFVQIIERLSCQLL